MGILDAEFVLTSGVITRLLGALKKQLGGYD
jgi:DNA recombination-dependent growth factor C